MDFLMHLKVIKFCKTINITKAQLIRQIYQLIKEHEGKDFKDINDLIQKLYPPRNPREAFYETDGGSQMTEAFQIDHYRLVVDYTADFHGDIRDVKELILKGDRVRVLRKIEEK